MNECDTSDFSAVQYAPADGVHILLQFGCQLSHGTVYSHPTDHNLRSVYFAPR